MSFDGFRRDSDDFGIIMTGTGGTSEQSAISSPFFTVFRCCCGRRAGAAPGEVEAGLARIGPIGRPIEGYLLTDCLRPQARSTRRAGWYCKRAISTLHGSIYRSLRDASGAGRAGLAGAARGGLAGAQRGGLALQASRLLVILGSFPAVFDRLLVFPGRPPGCASCPREISAVRPPPAALPPRALSHFDNSAINLLGKLERCHT